MVQILVTLTVVGVLASFALPATVNALRNYRLTGAVAATAVISATRDLEIMHGHACQLTFTPATNSFQVYNGVFPVTTYSAVGTAAPISRPGDVSMRRTVTYQFNANGTVTGIPTAGNMFF